MKKVARTEIPRKAVYRLSVYLRCLHRLLNNSIHTVSSEVLAKAAGVMVKPASPWLVRLMKVR